MKRWLLGVIAALIVSIGAGFFVPNFQKHWILEVGNGSELVLSEEATSHGGPPATLQIRCDGGKSEVRLYIPLRRTPPAGLTAGPEKVNVSEEFQDQKTGVAVVDAGTNEPFDWIVAHSGTFASRTNPSAFIGRMAIHHWLYLRLLGFTGGKFSESVIMFPVKGLGEYKARIEAACGISIN